MAANMVMHKLKRHSTRYGICQTLISGNTFTVLNFVVDLFFFLVEGKEQGIRKTTVYSKDKYVAIKQNLTFTNFILFMD